MNLRFLALGSLMAVVSGCGGSNERNPNVGPGPVTCPAGQSFDGQQCVASVSPPPSGNPTTPTTTTTPPEPPVPTATPGPSATPVDPSLAAAAAPAVDALAKQHLPAGAKPIATLAGQFATGQMLESQIQMQSGRCYTVVGAGLPGVENLDLQLAPVSPMPNVSPILAQDSTVAPDAVIGQKPNCFKWAAPFAAPMRVIVRVSAGQGLALVRVYES
ncbi:MAG: hypothetical protein KC776_03765 [Myxococcales bacterium]|nr:hypothetical protein [Myxococcales bacterium]MCB9576461.1 hypothetical protein [Polyangiaceae bacterium]